MHRRQSAGNRDGECNRGPISLTMAWRWGAALCGCHAWLHGSRQFTADGESRDRLLLQPQEGSRLKAERLTGRPRLHRLPAAHAGEHATYKAMVKSTDEEQPLTTNAGGGSVAEVPSSGAALAIKLQAAKGFDEVLGSAVSDGVLELGFGRIRSALRRQDQAQTTGRGEISILLGEAASLEAVEQLARRLVDLVQRAYVVQGQVLFLQAFVGVAVPSPKGTREEILCAQADAAMKVSAMEAAGTVTCFEEDMLRRVRARHALIGDLRKALPLRQLEVHYQPQVLLPSCRLIGFEALLRWRHPELGWISPAEFIPLAEEIGIIANLGNWVLRTACKQLLSLPDTLTIAVNVSPLQLKHGSLCRSVTEALSASRIPACRLELEITEGILLERSGVVRSTLDNLHEMGVRLAIDDFGTGYSSLGQLGNLPFDTIKIDRSLVGTGARNRTIVRAIAMLGHGLGMATLIEGIESEEELTRACEDGCESAQGYLFGRPVPASHLPHLVSQLGTGDLPRPVIM